MAEFYNWDITAVNNSDAPPDGAPEGMEYDEVNNTIRELMAQAARYRIGAQSGNNVTATSTTAYTLTTGQTLGAYAEGQLFAFTAHATSTGAVTLNVDGLGAGNVLDARGNQLVAGDIRQNGYYVVRRTASGDFRTLGHLASASVASTINQSYLAGGTADAITITTGLFTAYANGQMIIFRGNATNTGAMTINIDGLGAEALEDWRSAALAAGDVQANRIYLAGRTNGEWRILTSVPIDLANDVTGTLPLTNGGTGGATADAALNSLIGSATLRTWAVGDTMAVQSLAGGTGGKVAASQVATGKQTIWVPASAMKLRTTGPAAGAFSAGSTQFDYLAFDPTTAEDATFSIAMPKGWDHATGISLIAYWLHPATTTNFGVAWQFFAKAYSNDDAIDGGSYIEIGTAVDTGGTTSDLYISPETSVTVITGAAQNDILNFIVRRHTSNGSDNMAVDAYLWGVKVLYTTNANTDV